MTKSEYADLTYFMIYRYKLVKNSDTILVAISTSRTISNFPNNRQVYNEGEGWKGYEMEDIINEGLWRKLTWI